MIRELPAPSVTGQRRVSVHWIVCGMTTRDVLDGVVACPFGGPAPLIRCRECRFLEAIESDWHQTDCTTPDEDDAGRLRTTAGE